MARYIDADEALRLMRNVKEDKPSYGDWDIACDCCIDSVEVVPTADVAEVVRCEKCKYRTEVTECNHTLYFCRKKQNYIKLNDFCSYGERKKGSNNKDLE